MSKFKYAISKKDLSWERFTPKMCDQLDCKKLGEYKAPKSRSKLNEYYFFCLQHVAAYNKSWDFYKGLSVDEIELSMRKDTVWDRPSWPLKGNPSKVMDQLEEFLANDYSLFEKEKEIQDFLKNKMIDEIVYLEGMISNLLLSDKLSTPYTNLNLRKTNINNFLDLLLELSNIKLSEININNETSIQYIYIDKTKMLVAIRNLIDNANKYGEDDPIGIEISDEKNTLLIKISNTFEKINESELDKIFIPFYRMQSTENKASGFGLGLTICKKIVESHGGSIDFEIKDKKIIFTITLPENHDFKK